LLALKQYASFLNLHSESRLLNQLEGKRAWSLFYGTGFLRHIGFSGDIYHNQPGFGDF
jgi:hypothetical protein